jgi:multicomponent Na+:H+ antiporter subunit D
MRLSFNVIGVSLALLNVFAVLGSISIVIGVTLALYQWDFKRLLAYHSISQIGYIVLGFGLGTPLGILGGLFHLLNHSVFKSLLFLNAGSVERATGKRNLKDLGGLSGKMPVTGTTSFIASMSISGIPPLNGFWSKLIIVIACVQSGHYWYGLIAALASILTLASFLKVQRYAFFGYLKDAFKEVRESPAAMTVPMMALAALCVVLGILLIPGIDNHFLKLAANTLVAGRDYAATFKVTP